MNNLKTILTILMLSFCLSCSKIENTTNKIEEINFDWIVGNWERTNNQKDKQTFEQWNKKSKNEYFGLGFTLQNKDTIFKENLKIAQNKGEWFLLVTGVNETPTPFLFSNYSDSSFICENEENEFPKIIEYSRSNNELTAIISDDSTTISFVFKNENE